MFSRSKKIISMLLVFVIVFSYMGETLEAVATTDNLSAITNGFFKTGEMKFSSYFMQEDVEKTEKISDVNEKATLFLEIAPNEIGQGFLKMGTIVANSLDGNDLNFKFSQIKNVTIEQLEDVPQYEKENAVSENEIEEGNLENQSDEESVTEEDKTVEENTISNEENTQNENVTNEIDNRIENEIENKVVENVTGNNTAEENVMLENEIENNRITNEVSSRSSESRIIEENLTQEKLTEEALEKVEEGQETYEELTAKDFEIEIINNNEIKVQNVIYNTIIEVEIEYNKKEKLNIADLYKEVNLKLNGTYINVKLEKIETEEENNIVIGWSNTQDFEISGEYTQFSPFRLGDHTGSIVQNKIKVIRETENENYFPIKQTTIEIEVPDYNGMAPETVNVQASKLMATKGEDLGNVNFGENNWKYDAQSKKIIITVTNENDGRANISKGEDEYIIVYRYKDYTEDETITMSNNFKVTVEGYSANENHIQTKEFNDLQKIKTQINDLITYNIGSTGEALNKAKINANYLSEQAQYETEFTTTVNVNVLTSDLLEEFKINSSKEVYLDNNSVEFDATQDIYYNKVKFNYSEIKNMLSNGTTIEIQTLTGELLYTLNNQTAINQDSCEIHLESKEKGIYVVFKNIANNGNISIEFTKAIGKSNYEKSAFQSFQTIKSCVSAELKYQNYEERYAMTEIATTKKMQNSQTSAELILTNNNLNPVVKNDGVEVRIALNNHKQNTDLYQNPSFELVFPKYITDVTVENMDLIYGCGLQIANSEIYKQDNLVKMRIDLKGTQNLFSESIMTNGTNIILDLNLVLNEYTPKKQDQIKLYYCNEAVTNYESQTKWNIQKNIPNGILKETNGYDVAVVNYQGAEGLVLANAIINYDGQASKIKSINQGEKTAEIKVYSDEQIAKMELVAMNNTKNVCSDITFLGRIPFEGNTSVVTKKSLGTNITTKMLSSIQESVQNPNMTTIYYSSNEKATKDLTNKANKWTTNVTDFSKVKSYMIVVKGDLQPGNILKFTYDFEIPEGLEYDRELYGSFGGFYNNNQENLISYESTEADKIGLVSEVKPELNVSVYPYGGNQEVYDGQIVTLVAKVENNSKTDLENALLKVSVPTGTEYVNLKDNVSEEETTTYLYNAYQNDKNVQHQEFKIEKLVAGEITYFEFEVKVLEDSSERYKKLEGYTEIEGIKQNYNLKVKDNKLSIKANLMEINPKFWEDTEIDFLVGITNLSSTQKENYKVSFSVPNYLTVNYVRCGDKELGFYVRDGKAVIDVGELPNQETEMMINCTIGKISVQSLAMRTVFNVYSSNKETNCYSSEVVKATVQKVYAQITQEISNSKLYYTNMFNYHAILQNQGEIETFVNLKMDFPINLRIQEMSIIVDGVEKKVDSYYYNDYEVKELLTANGKIEIVATGRVTNMDGILGSRKFSHILVAQLSNGIQLESEPLQIEIISSADNTGANTNISNEELTTTQNTTEQTNNNYSISGNIYVDFDKNGEKTEGDKTLKSQVQVQLLKGSKMIKATTTDSTGNYLFSGLEPGEYSISYNYDKENYTSVQTNDASKMIETEEGVSVTDNVTIIDNSIENMNVALQEKDKFDFEIKQYIMSASVNIKGQEIEYDYDKLELAKIEIDPSDLKNAMVKLKYKIIVTNTGNQEGQVTSIVDYLPNGVSFNQSENQDWTIGTIEGNIYYDGLKGIPILPGESQEILLTLNKKMTEDNTGVISNKVQIAYTESSTRLTEAIEGNFASQETIVTLTQGSHSGLTITITTISITGIIGLFGYMIQTGKLDKKFNGKKWIKKVYK